ncbi:unnamed protein product [Symbiodinium pilosum]|uniref:Uncharacterized protein n=1 Tax=Symbiodinium pilosum TaxID=2952 RepID=A0A812XFF9_SYMPI|nr:unnamed protein product [Symbiodinium pilosum]
MADPDLWKRTVAHSALQHLAANAHKKIAHLQQLTSDLEVERDLVAADLQVMALEELMTHSPSPERDVPLCEERRAVNGRKRAALPAAPPLGPMPDGTFRSTVDSWNRKRDRKWVENRLGIPEEGDGSTTFVNELDTSVVIAVGYRRVLYGDHGPYLEFTKHQIKWESFPVVKPDKPSHAYYDERFTEDQHVKAYEQRKTVRDKPNPPPGPWSASHNRFDTGYADYQPGYVYVSAAIPQMNKLVRTLSHTTRASSVYRLESGPTSRNGQWISGVLPLVKSKLVTAIGFFFSPDESTGGCQGPDYHFGDKERQWRSAWKGECAFLYRNEPEDKKVLHWRSPRSDEYDACYRLACKEFCRTHWCMSKTVAAAVWSFSVFLVLTSLCCCAIVGYKLGSQLSSPDRRELGGNANNVCSSASSRV